MTEFTADGVDRTTTLKVSGLTCGHCVAHVTEELEALDGVKNVSVLLNKGGQSTVTVLSDVRLEDAALAEAMARNVYGEPQAEHAGALANYALASRSALGQQDFKAVLATPAWAEV